MQPAGAREMVGGRDRWTRPYDAMLASSGAPNMCKGVASHRSAGGLGLSTRAGPHRRR